MRVRIRVRRQGYHGNQGYYGGQGPNYHNRQNRLERAVATTMDAVLRHEDTGDYPQQRRSW